MGFFITSDNKEISATGNFDSNVEIEPIPANSQLMAVIDEAKWDSYEGVSFIKLRWAVVGGEFKNRKVFHKIHVEDTDPKRKDRALTMLAAIDTNAGGALQRLGTTPEDHDLMNALANRPMFIKVQVWSIDDKKGNWVSAVAAAGQQQQAAPTGDVPF